MIGLSLFSYLLSVNVLDFYISAEGIITYLTKTQHYHNQLKEKHQINWDSVLAVLKIIIHIFSKLYFIVLVVYWTRVRGLVGCCDGLNCATSEGIPA